MKKINKNDVSDLVLLLSDIVEAFRKEDDDYAVVLTRIFTKRVMKIVNRKPFEFKNE